MYHNDWHEFHMSVNCIVSRNTDELVLYPNYSLHVHL